MKQLLETLLNDESGATALEYALIGSLVSVGIIAALDGFSSSNAAVYTTVSDAMDTAMSN